MSPACASVASTRSSPRKPHRFVTRTFVCEPSPDAARTDRHAVADLQHTVEDAADAHAPEVVVVVERRDLKLQGLVVGPLRFAHVVDDRLQQRLEIGGLLFELVLRPPFLARCVEDGEIELIVGRFEVDEEIEDHVEHFVGPSVGSVDLVDHDDRLKPELQRFAQHELRLRHRPFERVDQQQDRVDHLQHPLDLTAEIGVSGRIDDVDLVVVPTDRGALRVDRDAAFAFQVVRIHRPLLELTVSGDRLGLFQELVDQGGFPVVDVGDDGDVSNTAHGARCVRGVRFHVKRAGAKTDDGSIEAERWWRAPRERNRRFRVD